MAITQLGAMTQGSASPSEGGSATDGLGQINSGAGTVGSALSRASAAIGGGGTGGVPGDGIFKKLSGTPGLGTPEMPGMDTGPQIAAPFKKGGKASSKGGDWHGFGSSKTGNTNHGF